jgi:hypothetical protein
MVESGVGRIERRQRWRVDPEARLLAEAQHGDVREPGPTLARVRVETLEPPLQILGEGGGAAVLVAEHEHADASRLAVALGGEARLLGGAGGVAQGRREGGELGARPAAEERERNVQVLRRDDPPRAGELPLLPCGECVGGVRGKANAEEEPKALIAPDASGRRGTSS